MINCFLDPIFLAINESISSKHFSEVLYPILFNFFQRIETIENETNQRVKFNISFELIIKCQEYNPFRFRPNIICNNWFKKFLSNFLKIHRNSNCDILSTNENIELQYNYINENIPSEIMNVWNMFLNQCSNCNNCGEKKLDLLSHDILGSKLSKNSLEFFDRIIFNFISWLNEQIFSAQIETQPTEVEIQPELKKKGNWSHSHPKIVMIEIEKLTNFKFIKEIRPIRNTRGKNRNEIRVITFNQYNIFISDKEGAQIFLVITSAKNESEGNKILEELSKQFSDYEVRK